MVLQCKTCLRLCWTKALQCGHQEKHSVSHGPMQGGCLPARHHPKPCHRVGVLHHPKPLEAMGSSTGLSVKPQPGVLAWGPCSRAQRGRLGSARRRAVRRCGKLGAALPALPMVLASTAECFTCLSSESRNKMTFIRCFKECSGM